AALSFMTVALPVSLAEQRAYGGILPERLAERLCGQAGPAFPLRNVVHNPAGGRQLRPRADGNVVRDADASAEHDIVPECHGTGNTAMPGNDASPADTDIVGNLHQIVDLGALTDHRVGKSSA